MSEPIQSLFLKLRPGREPRFLSIFQQGIYLRTRTGSTMAQVLDAAGFTRKYLEERVQTVFLDGSAIDDPDSEIVRGGCVIALSAAMPGLAGAILRKGSPISALRSKTSAQKDLHSTDDAIETLRLKLFNRVAEEMGPELLHRGILLKRSDFENFMASRPGLMEEAVLEAELDGVTVSPAGLLGGKSIRSDYVVLRVLRST